ncbi:MAG: DNA replication/repair protein RecF [Gemmatimonadaceae bacterium]
MSDVPLARRSPDATSPGRFRLRHLAVRDFRNLERLDLDLPPDGIAVVGENGHGKTNLLEAVYYLQLLRSVRGARDQDLVRFGAAGFHVAARADAGDGTPRAVAVGFERASKRKRARRDGAEPPRLSDALGALPSVIFSPGDVQLVAGAPSERRRYLDVALALTSRRYLVALQHYRAALARRNAALRDAARSGASDARVAVWEPALAEHGALLWAERVAWVERSAPEFAALCAAIGERGAARMRYASALVAPAGADVPRRAELLAEALHARRALDLRRGVTHAGPHRDDLDLQLDGRDLRSFGSAGQQRTAAIALRMLEAATLRDAAGAAPLFLLDDPFAELDARRAHRILELLGAEGLGQTLLVVPRAVDIPPELTRLERWDIRDGVLSRGAGRGTPAADGE